MSSYFDVVAGHAIGVTTRARRVLRHWWQRRTRGFDDTVTWSLDYSLAKLIAPRLRAFRDEEARSGGTPGVYIAGAGPCPEATPEEHAEWLADLDKMIAAFDRVASDRHWSDDEAEEQETREGILLFAEHYFDLWT